MQKKFSEVKRRKLKRKNKNNKTHQRKKAIIIEEKSNENFFYKDSNPPMLARITALNNGIVHNICRIMSGNLSSFSRSIGPLEKAIIRDFFKTAERPLALSPNNDSGINALLYLSYVSQAISGHIENGHSIFRKTKLFPKQIKEFERLEERILRGVFNLERIENEANQREIVNNGPYFSIDYIVSCLERAYGVQYLRDNVVILRQVLMDATVVWIDKIIKSLRKNNESIIFKYGKEIEILKDPKKRRKIWRKYYGVNIEAPLDERRERTYQDFVERIKHMPLLGLQIFEVLDKHFEIESLDEKISLLKGIVEGAFMDNAKERTEAEKEYKKFLRKILGIGEKEKRKKNKKEKICDRINGSLEFGKGCCVVVSIDRIREIVYKVIATHLGHINPNIVKVLSREAIWKVLHYMENFPHSKDQKKELIRSGVLAKQYYDRKVNSYEHENKNHISAYYRFERGSGVNDDAMMVILGVINPFMMVGAFISDWFDTMGKYSLFYGAKDKDEAIGSYMRKELEKIRAKVRKNKKEKAIKRKKQLIRLALAADKVEFPLETSKEICYESRIGGHASQRYLGMVSNDGKSSTIAYHFHLGLYLYTNFEAVMEKIRKRLEKVKSKKGVKYHIRKLSESILKENGLNPNHRIGFNRTKYIDFVSELLLRLWFLYTTHTISPEYEGKLLEKSQKLINKREEILEQRTEPVFIIPYGMHTIREGTYSVKELKKYIEKS